MEYDDFVPDSDDDEQESGPWGRQSPLTPAREFNETVANSLEQALRDDDALGANEPAQQTAQTSVLENLSANDVVRARATHKSETPVAKEVSVSDPSSLDPLQQLSREAARDESVGQATPRVQAATPEDAAARARAHGNERAIAQQDADTHGSVSSHQSDDTRNTSGHDSRVRVFQVGDLVEVESRTWPGINKPGGSGRVAAVHQETSAAGELEVFYDVRYVLGGFEKHIESAYVELSHILQLERAQGRVRYERVFYHDEFADVIHKKKRPLYDPNASLDASSTAVPPNSELLDAASALSSAEPAKRRKRSRHRRSDGKDGSASRRRIDRNSAHSEQSATTTTAAAALSASGSERSASQSDSQDSDGWESTQVIRRIGDRTFLMDIGAKSRDTTSGRARGRDLEQPMGPDTSRSGDDKWRRRRRIVESDGDDDHSDDDGVDGGGGVSSEGDALQHRSASTVPQTSSSHSRVRQPRVRSAKKRRYVGGYLHSGDGVDATFIQPEDNANALPDDVARELGFKLGKSKAELRVQLATIARVLTANLRKFEDERAVVTRKTKRALGLSTDELQAFHRQAMELESFLTQSLIRGGEDVMNAVIVKLTKKGGSLPDSVELVFDDQKRAISDHGVWIRKVLASLETAFKVRGVALPSDDVVPRVEASASSDDDNVRCYSSDEFDASVVHDSDAHGRLQRYDTGASSSTSRSVAGRQTQHNSDARRNSSSPRRHAADRHSRKRSQKIDAFIASHHNSNSSLMAMNDRRRQHARTSKYPVSTTLDDFDFVQYSEYSSTQHQRNAFAVAHDSGDNNVLPTSNIRLPGKKRPMTPSDPRWNWFQMGRLKEQAQARARRTHGASADHSSSGSTTGLLGSASYPSQRSHKRRLQEKLLGHVQSARLQLRERKQRLQSSRAAVTSSVSTATSLARAYGQGYGPPPQPSGSVVLTAAHRPAVVQHAFRGESMPTVTPPFASTYEYAPTIIGNNSSSGGRMPVAVSTTGALSHYSQPPSSATAILQTESRVEWATVFDVLVDAVVNDELVQLAPATRTFLMTCGFAQCSCDHHAPATGNDGDDDSSSSNMVAANDNDVVDDVRGVISTQHLATLLRQSLTALRFQEREFMDSLPGGSVASRVDSADSTDSVLYTDTVAWRALIEAADRYHASLVLLVHHAVDAVRDCLQLRAAAGVNALVRSVAAEVVRTLAQLPDCDALFDSCRSYVFFFEVADRDARTTPLMTAITRTYWHSIELLINLKAAASAMALPSAVAQVVESAVESVLPMNRAVLAASLFLVDLYLYLPSSHRLESFDASLQQQQHAVVGSTSGPPSCAPALSLWLLLYDCFATGKCSFQSGKRSASGGGRDFWALLQTLYRDHFVDHLAVAFTQSRSSSGYLVDSVPKLSAAPDDAEDVAQGQLLALQSVWSLCLLFLQIFPAPLGSSSHDDATSEARWAVARDLLQPGRRAFLPFSSNVSESAREFGVYASIFKLHVLQNVLVFSKLSSPQSDIVERLLEELWDDSSGAVRDEQRELVELSSFWIELLLHAVTPGGLSAFVAEWKADAADRIDLISGIILIQILKFEKPIHRNRFRQPICRAIAARLDATKPSAELVAATPAAAPVSATVGTGHAKPVVGKPKAWNWGSSSTTASSDVRLTTHADEPARKSQQSATPRGYDEERLMVSILLALAVSSICTDAPTSAASSSVLRAPAQRANKQLKRDLEFYYKEMARIVQGSAEHSVLIGQALYVMGRVAMAHSNEYAAVFAYLNDHVVSIAQSLRALRGRHADKEAAPSAALKHQSRLLQRGVLSSLYLMRDLTQRLCALVPSIPNMSAMSSTAASPSTYALDAVRASLSSILNTGLEACLDAAVDELLPIDALHIALEILHALLPRAADAPVRCLQVAAVSSTVRPDASAGGEFDEFDDLYSDDVWASVDLDKLAGGGGSGGAAAGISSPPLATLKTFEDTILQSVLTHLRVVLQRVVIKYPLQGLVSFHELYAVELLGALVSTCSFPFAWSLVASSALKPRVLAPRLLSAVLKYDGAKEWFSTCFLSESGADQELATLWLMATLDLQALFPAPCTLQPSVNNRFTFPVETHDDSSSKSSAHAAAPVTTSASSQIRYSNYWFMLTDAIVYNTLRANQVAQYKMDPLLLQLLRTTVQHCAFVTAMQQQQVGASQEPPSDLRTLYALHLDVFQEFCRRAGELWRALAADAAARRSDMNRFRLKMMDVHSGVFASFPEAFEINLKMVCQDLDRARRNWYALSERFLRDFAAAPPSGSATVASGAAALTNWHAIDESLELAASGELRDDPGVRVLIVLFRFMYGCVDAFLCHCGAMAIGQQNIFFAILKLMFRQASCAEFPQAEKRLLQLQQVVASQHAGEAQQSKWFDTTATSLDRISAANGGSGGNSLLHAPSRTQKPSPAGGAKNVSPACLGFVESVRLFFARQKYPSLLHWFAQTLETYQTVKRGWSSSPLRKLLLNVLDPHGPLGVHSYYPIEANGSASVGRAFDVRHVRREAFYLSCGLFVCRCTSAYEHTRPAATAMATMTAPAAAALSTTDTTEAGMRLRTLRKFILNDFVQETLDYAAGDAVVLHETLVPMAQFVRAVVSHCNLNLAHQQEQRPATSCSEAAATRVTSDLGFEPTEVYYCLASLLLYCVKTFSASAVLQSSISCVMALELCGIVSEMVALNDALYDSDVSALLELALAYFCEIFTALGETSSNVLKPVFATTTMMTIATTSDGPSDAALPTTRELLATFRPISSHGIHAVKIETALSPDSTASSAALDEYGISRLRVRADLVVSIVRLAERCKRSSDLRLRRFAAAGAVVDS